MTLTTCTRAPHTRASAAALAVQNTRTLPPGQLTLRFGNGDALDGTFDGYASLWNTTDSYGTRWLPGAWQAGGLDSGTYPLLVMHDPTRVAGTFTAREDERGLRIEGRFDATQEGQDARARAQSGSARELSVGFGEYSTLAEDDTGIIASRLVEVSLITARMASQPGAGMAGVRFQAQDVRRPEATRAYVVLPGTVEERLQNLGGAVSAWASGQYGEPSDTNRWHVSTEGTYTDRVVVTVTTYSADYEQVNRESWSLPYAVGDSNAVTIGEPERVELSATVTPAARAAAPLDADRTRRLHVARARLLLT